MDSRGLGVREKRVKGQVQQESERSFQMQNIAQGTLGMNRI